MLSFENLPEIVLGEDHGVFLLGRVYYCVTNIDQVGAERKMRPVLLDNAEGKHARSLRLLNGRNEIPGREFFPLHR